jgi:2'-5' RNA ligase
VPAHVTVLYPFVHPADVTPDVLAGLTAAVCRVSAFECRFEQTRWFGEEVLWLDPEPAEPFRRLTTIIWRAFPGFPPYGGRYEQVIPHLTIADGCRGGLPARQAAEQAVRTGLPRSATIDRVLLIAGAQAPNSWRLLSEVPLPPTP